VRTILKADSSNLYLKYPLDFDPAPGLEFTAFPGCSRLSTGANGCQTYWGGDGPTISRLPLHARRETRPSVSG
jgi:hypothetical protein